MHEFLRDDTVVTTHLLTWRLNLKTMLTFLVTAYLFLSIPAAQTANDDPKSAVEHVLLAQQDAWNHHDLDAFMTG